jgi:hypothetical protein
VNRRHPELILQVGFHRWPLGIDDAVIDRMADALLPTPYSFVFVPRGPFYDDFGF